MVAGLQPDAADLVASAAKEDLTALRDEAQPIRAKLARLRELYIDGTIGEEDLISGRQKVKARLADTEIELAELGRESVLAPMITAENAADEWEGLGNDRRRAIIDALMEITLDPPGQAQASLTQTRSSPSNGGSSKLRVGWSTMRMGDARGL